MKSSSDFRLLNSEVYLHADALIDAFNGALAEEIAYLQNEGGRPLVVLDGC